MIDPNDLQFVKKRYGTPTHGWGDFYASHFKIGKETVSVFHVKPVYYEHIVGDWRPLSEITEFHGNKKIILKRGWEKHIHPRYIAWLSKRQERIGGFLFLPSPVEYGINYQKTKFLTSTFYPDPFTESTCMDGYVRSVNQTGTWANERAASAGTLAATDSATLQLIASVTGGPIWSIYRWFILFDTSSLGDENTIVSATLSFNGASSITDTDSFSICIVSSSPASDTTLGVDDYNDVGTTEFASRMTYAAWQGSGYNDFALNASGLAAITKTGISKFGARSSGDLDNTAPTGINVINADSADATGTSEDPKLAVVNIEPFIPVISML